MRRRALPVAAVAAATLLAAPAAASASTARATAFPPEPGLAPEFLLTYTAAPGEANRVTISSGLAPGDVRVHDEAAVITPGAGCVRVDDNTVVCSPGKLLGSGVPTGREFVNVRADLGDRADDGQVEGETLHAELEGGAGGDILRAGGRGATLDGGTGRDVLEGGPGPDVLAESDETARDQIDGGTGRDRLDYTRRRRGVSVDLAAGRGADGDRVRRVEDVTGGRVADRLYGGPGVNAFDGGPGNDSLAGRGGTDHLAGGAGRDVLAGGAGRDTLDASDGGRRPQPDRARCGKGTDVVSTPAAVDHLSRDCDYALLTTGSTGGSAVLVHQPLRAQRSGLVEFRLSVPRTERTFRGRVSLRFRGILLGRPTRQVTLSARGRATVRVSLVGPALARLREMRRMTVEVVVNEASFTTVLRAPLPPPTDTGGTPS